MPKVKPFLLLAMAPLLSACASADSGALSPVSSAAAAERTGAAQPPTAAATTASPGLQTNGTYVLSPAELELSCKKLTGRAMVRILQLRDHDLSRRTSLASRSLQQVATPIFGGTRYGADPEAAYRRDLAMLEAYNRRLAEKRCKTFDLVKELQPKPAAESPTVKK